MTAALKSLAPRRYVPPELRSALIGNLDDEGAACIARLIVAVIMRHKKPEGRQRPPRMVFVDIDNSVYAARPDFASADLLLIMHPELLVGMYDAKADAGDIASDLETFRRGV